MTTPACAGGRSIPDRLQRELIGRVYLDSGHERLTPQVRQEIDKYVARIKGKYTNEIIRIEGSYHRSASRRDNIDRSLRIAREVERYLRLHHQLQLNLCIATDDGATAHNDRTSVAIFVYPGEFAEKKI
jgi:hypothetical protein